MGDEPPKEEKKKHRKSKKEADTGDAGEGGGEKKEGKRAQRATSNVFGMFTPNQIQEFKEAFGFIDQNRDGFIDIDDLKDTYASMGLCPSDSDLNEMLEESPGPLNFTMFINLFGGKLHGTDPESAIVNAFAMFDDEHTMTIPEEYFKDLLKNMGDNFSEDELRQVWKDAPFSGGKLLYKDYAQLMCRGSEQL